MKKWITRKFAALLAVVGIAGWITYAYAAGMFPGIPAMTFPLSGTETIPMDTGLSGGRYPQTQVATPKQLRQYASTPTTLTDQATILWSGTDGDLAMVTLGANRTMGTPTNVYPGQVLRLIVTQDGTGSRLMTWNGVFRWPAGTAPTLTTTAGRSDLLTFVCDQVSAASTSSPYTTAVRCLGTSSLNYTSP